MKISFNKIAILQYCIGASLIAGCAAPTYVPPASGPTARVTFTSPNPTINNPVLIHTEKCTDKDAKLVGQLYSRALGQPNVTHLDAIVAADQKLSVSMLVGDIAPKDRLPPLTATLDGSHTWEKRHCRAIVEFIPRAGKKYKVTYATDLQQCFYVVEQASENHGAEVWQPMREAQVREHCHLPSYWAP